MPSSTAEDYLKGLLLAQRPGSDAPVSTGAIAEALGVSPGTATAMVQSLASDGLVVYEPYKGALLTPEGRRAALAVLRRHRLVELFLVEVMGYDWSEVHGEAERLEHVVSERFVERMDEMLGFPKVDPHGDPIPDASGSMETLSGICLASCDPGVRGTVVRVTDQERGFLRALGRLALRPGKEMEVVSRDEAADAIVLRDEQRRSITLGLGAASKIYISPEATGS